MELRVVNNIRPRGAGVEEKQLPAQSQHQFVCHKLLNNTIGQPPRPHCSHSHSTLHSSFRPCKQHNNSARKQRSCREYCLSEYWIGRGYCTGRTKRPLPRKKQGAKWQFAFPFKVYSGIRDNLLFIKHC